MLVLIFGIALSFGSLLFLFGEHYQVDSFVDIAEQVTAPGDNAPGTLEFLNSDPTV